MRLIQGDCLEVLKTLPDGCVDAVVTDPPYGVGYGAWDSEAPPQEFLSECLRVSSGAVLWFGASVLRAVLPFANYDPQPERMLIWAPSFTLRQAHKHSMYYRFHTIWCWRLPVDNDRIHADVLRHPCDGKCWWKHPATKPLQLMLDLVGAFSQEGGVVLDPFMGSGTTGVACVREGRDFIGIELNPDYFAIAERRIREAEAHRDGTAGELFAKASLFDSTDDERVS